MTDQLFEEREYVEPDVPTALDLGESAGPFVGLLDLRFRKLNAVRMAPLAYGSIVALSAVGCIALDILAFSWSSAVGLITTLVVTPALFVVLVVLTRFVLEFMLSLLVLPAHLARVTYAVENILGTTTTIVGTTTDISSDTSGLGVMQPLKRLYKGRRTRIVPTDG